MFLHFSLRKQNLYFITILLYLCGLFLVIKKKVCRLFNITGQRRMLSKNIISSWLVLLCALSACNNQSALLFPKALDMAKRAKLTILQNAVLILFA